MIATYPCKRNSLARGKSLYFWGSNLYCYHGFYFLAMIGARTAVKATHYCFPFVWWDLL